jgi:hypothetical protein
MYKLLFVSVTGPLTQEAVGDAVLEEDDIELDCSMEDDDDMEEVWLALVLALWPTDVLEIMLDPLVVWPIAELEAEEPRVVEEIDGAEDVDDEALVIVVVMAALLAPGM